MVLSWTTFVSLLSAQLKWLIYQWQKSKFQLKFIYLGEWEFFWASKLVSQKQDCSIACNWRIYYYYYLQVYNIVGLLWEEKQVTENS